MSELKPVAKLHAGNGPFNFTEAASIRIGNMRQNLRAESPSPHEAIKTCFSLQPVRRRAALLSGIMLFGLLLGFFVKELGAITTICIGCSILLYRQKLRHSQLLINSTISDSVYSLNNIVLYLRPFFAAGQMRVNTTAARFLDAVMLGGRWDVELAITFALERRNSVVALGQVKGEYGAAKLTVDDTVWQKTMMDLAARAIAIINVPLNRPATLWEVRHLFLRNPYWRRHYL